MIIKLYNTLTGEIDEFVSQKLNQATIYTCGPTVYNFAHIGNWAAYIYWDVLVRMLAINNYEVIRAMNITDVGHLTSDADEGDDKLEKGAVREGKTAWEVARYYTDDFLRGMKRLNLVIPKYIARATDFVPRQLDMIRVLKQKGMTYQTSDGIYFDTSKFPTYADFAHLDLKGLRAGARIEYNKEKRNITDFALWKFTPIGKKRDMEWPTPQDLIDPSDNTGIVMGFPGWHIECSAIAKNFLGDTLDIHCGGIDHIPVHHTNEIAQSESANGARFSNYWLHNNFLKSDGKKMSKSLGNCYLLDDIESKGFSMMDFRMFVLQGHYRSEGNFTFENLQSAKNRLNNWRNVAAIRHQIHGKFENCDKPISLLAASNAIVEAVNNDLGTPDALRIIDDVFSDILSAKLENIDRAALVQLLETIDSLLGIQLISSTPDISDETKQMLLQRNMARGQKDWKLSDEIRDQLQKQGIILRDTSEQTIWEYK